MFERCVMLAAAARGRSLQGCHPPTHHLTCLSPDAARPRRRSGGRLCWATRCAGLARRPASSRSGGALASRRAPLAAAAAAAAAATAARGCRAAGCPTRAVATGTAGRAADAPREAGTTCHGGIERVPGAPRLRRSQHRLVDRE